MKKIGKILAIGSVLLVFSSCGIYNKYEHKAEVPADLFGSNPSTSSLGEAGRGLAELSWREFFTDPLLQQLIDTALVRNTDLNSARIALEKSQVEYKTAKLAYLPSLGLNASGALSSFDSAPVSKTYTVPLQLDWQLDIFGTLTNQKRQAAALLEQTRNQEEATRTNLISTVARLYNQLLIYDRQLEILLSTEKIWASSLEVQRVLMENGKAYSTAVNQMEASYINVKTQIVDTRREINSTELELCRLLTITPRHIERSQWDAFRLPAGLDTGIPAALLTHRPDIKAAERAMEAAFYNTNAARSAFYPSVTLGGLIGWTNSAGIVTDPGKLLWNAVASLTQPIFARGKLRANLKISKLTQQDIANRYVQTVISAGNQVNEAMADCQASQQKDLLYKRQVAVLHDAFDGTHELMNNGKANYLEVLTAQEALLSAQLAEAMNLYRGSIAKISLYMALGGATK